MYVWVCVCVLTNLSISQQRRVWVTAVVFWLKTRKIKSKHTHTLTHAFRVTNALIHWNTYVCVSFLDIHQNNNNQRHQQQKSLFYLFISLRKCFSLGCTRIIDQPAMRWDNNKTKWSVLKGGGWGRCSNLVSVCCFIILIV